MALKRIKSETDHRSLGHVRFWLEDITAVVELIKQAAPGPMQITIDEVLSASDIADLADYPGERMTSLIVLAPGVSLVLGPRVATISLEEPNDLTLIGMANEVQRIAKERRLIVLPLATAIKTTFGTTAFRIVHSAGLVPDTPDSSALLIARSRRDAPTWLERNKDGLTTNLIVSIGFYLLGLFTPVIVKFINGLIH